MKTLVAIGIKRAGDAAFSVTTSLPKEKLTAEEAAQLMAVTVREKFNRSHYRRVIEAKKFYE